ncbi:MAG: cardiolipin synthase B [Geobacteraceae bacterium]|nr:cardiolipin synthase B [Geobacteraceae bacterium]
MQGAGVLKAELSTLVTQHGRLLRLRNSRLYGRIFKRNKSLFITGNHTVLYQQGGDFFPALFAAIDTAGHQLLLEYYIIHDDIIGRRFAAALIDAVARGVQVCLIYDYLGSFDTPASYFEQLEAQGVQLLCFNKLRWGRGLGWLDKRNHRKTAVIDGSIAFLGGLNIGDEYSGFGDSTDRWRDCGMHVTGPVVEELRKLYWDTWQHEHYPIPVQPAFEPPAQTSAGTDTIILISGGPHHRRSFIKQAYRLAITGAQESLIIVTPYFLPGLRLVRTMLKAVKRGVSVTLILPGQSDVPILKIVGHAYLALLLKAGVAVYERQGTVLHAKLMLVDECWVQIGSANFDQRSFHRNFETNLVVESQEFSGNVLRMLQDDILKSRMVALDEHTVRKWYEPLLELLFSTLNRFL